MTPEPAVLENITTNKCTSYEKSVMIMIYTEHTAHKATTPGTDTRFHFGLCMQLTGVDIKWIYLLGKLWGLPS